jgi:hypothetical protein
MALKKERMAEYQRERRAKLAALKADPGMKAMAPIQTKSVDPPMASCRNGCEVVRILEDAVRDLLARVQVIEREISPEEMTRKQATKPGSRPNELYGA